MENVCRICLCSPKQLQPLFDGTQLCEKIGIISSVVIEENDGYPNSACDDCIINVNICYNFRLVVINSDVELRQRTTQSSKVIDEEAALLTSELIIKREESDIELEQTDNREEREVAEERVIKEEEVENDMPEIKIYECQKCGFITQNLKLYRKHNLLRNRKSGTGKCDGESDKAEKKKYTCKECDFVTEDLKLYRKHKHPGNLKSETGICNICGKTMRITYLTRHIKSHETSPTECNVCGKVCRNSESLRDHKRLHKAPKICEYCGKSCNQRTYFFHVRLHHKGGMKKYNCSFCDKTFYRTERMKRHMQTHTGERPFICEFCLKGFSSRDALKTHKRQHTNEMPYECKLCPGTFKQRVLLRNHLKTKHPGQEYSF